MKKSIFEYSGYKAYLRDRVGHKGVKKGIKSALARALGCQATYLSQILHASADLSLEQAERVNEFFGHGKDESRFYLLLVQKDRAGTSTLRQHFQEQLDEINQRRLILTSRLGQKTKLTEADQTVYYSSWIYAALHIALTIPELRTREALAHFFNLPLKRIGEALDFLVSVGLADSMAKGDAVEYHTGKAQVRLGNDSPNILRHHSNWRTQALEALDREQITDLHYSGVVSISRKDVVKIKELLLEAVSDSQKIVKDSAEEELYAIAIDFFTLRKT